MFIIYLNDYSSGTNINYFSKLHVKFKLSDDIGIASYIITVKENDDAKIDTKADKENIVKKDGNHILPSTEETTEELVFTTCAFRDRRTDWAGSGRRS